MLSPIIEIFGIKLKIYSFFYFISILLVGEFTKYYLKVYKNEKYIAAIDDYFYIGAFSGFVGARLWYVASDFAYYLSEPLSILKVWEGGIAVQGGMAGVVIALWYSSRFKKTTNSLLAILSVSAMYALVAQAIGRWGNFYNQEVYGIAISKEMLNMILSILVPLQMAFLIYFIWNHNFKNTIKNYKKNKGLLFLKSCIIFGALIMLIRFIFGYRLLMINHLFIDGQYRLPLFIIEGNLNIIAFLIIWKYSQKNNNFYQLPSYLIAYGTIRSSLELLRNEMDIMRIMSIPVSFVISIIFIIIGFYLNYKLKKEA